ncbi:hypothetical protein PAE9249_05171 [Paenibacillus sp. CECT 9249]|uniref:hypothetical protein n=1 Tax=Paenibacillus sp. CECT 9249 TaxID=2845385 RepID=UPI001E315CB1|nr:hypothetical protein [Paenibacillus sp. CECT 9249]CAH0122599.1 hypothetical protein PAE9249_05171 [Paenibacillus sp. CECT 9249]
MKKIFRRILKFLNIIIKYIFTEIIIKYFFCYLIAGFGFIYTLSLEDDYLIKGYLINISSSLISLPLVFVFYDLYKSALTYKSTKLVNQVVEKEINNIFLKFTYFTTHFYNEFSHESSYDVFEIENELTRKEEDIFNKVSSNIHHGYFLFSIFDDFNRDITQVINTNTIIRSIHIKELSILQQFMNDYIKLQSCFNWITKNDFIKFNQLSDVIISKSEFISSSDSNEFFDIKKRIGPDKTATYYSAKFRLYESDVLASGYKLSGNKAKEISKCLFQLYSSINNWKKFKNIDQLVFENGIISANRLHLDDNITFNEHMRNNFSIHGQF